MVEDETEKKISTKTFCGRLSPNSEISCPSEMPFVCLFEILLLKGDKKIK